MSTLLLIVLFLCSRLLVRRIGFHVATTFRSSNVNSRTTSKKELLEIRDYYVYSLNIPIIATVTLKVDMCGWHQIPQWQECWDDSMDNETQLTHFFVLFHCLISI